MKTNKKSRNKSESESSSSSDSDTSSKNNSHSKSREESNRNKRKSFDGENSKRENRDENSRNKRYRNDDKDDHRSREIHEHTRKEKHNNRDTQPERNRYGDSYRDRKRNEDKERTESDRYRRYREDKEEQSHYDRSKTYHKYPESRDRTRNREERRFPPRDGSRHRNQSGDYRRDNRFRNRRDRSRSGSFDHTSAKWGKSEQDKKDKGKTVEKEKPNFGLSGKLTEETNTYKGVVIKYSEPPEARKPKRRWRLYPFKGEQALQTLYIHRESAYLIGRDRKVVDLPVDHPSCSKQHAALQYRLVPFKRDDGSDGKRVRPYLIDLDSANGTFINNKKIDPKKYVELLEKDVIKFGFSSREYVLLHENSKDEAQDDDVKQEEEIEVTQESEH